MSTSFDEQSTQFFKSRRQLFVPALATDSEHFKIEIYKRPPTPDVNVVPLQQQRPTDQGTCT